jgi:hypothetical protein
MHVQEARESILNTNEREMRESTHSDLHYFWVDFHAIINVGKRAVPSVPEVLSVSL